MSIAPRQEGTVFFDPLKEKEAKRRRKYAETLQKQAQTPLDTQMVSGIAVQRNPLEFLAKGVQSYMGNRAETQADEIEAQQARKRQEMLSQAISQFGTDPMASAQGLMLDPATQEMGLKIALEEQQRQRAGNGIFSGNSIDAQMANQLAQAGYSPVDIAKMHYTRTMTLPGGGVVAIGPEGLGLPSRPVVNQPQPSPSVPLTGQTGPVIQQTAPNRATSLNPSAVGDPLAEYENFITGFDGASQQPTRPTGQAGVTTLVEPKLTPDQQTKLDNEARDRQSDISSTIGKADQVINVLDQLMTDSPTGATLNKGVDAIVGGPFGLQGYQSSIMPVSPNQRKFQPFIDQIKGQAFLQAFESLKGGGQITQVEGEKATQAIARLAQYQSEADFAKALKELRDIAVSAKNRAQEKLGNTAQPDIDPAVLEFMTSEERALFQ